MKTKLTQKPASKLDRKSILLEADKLINGVKREAYGGAEESFDRIAKVWSIILKAPITPRQVGLCMIGFKLCREIHKADSENLIDLAAYAALTNQVK